MRPGNNNRRGRNRGPRKQHGGIPNKNQSYDGGGSETRVRGNVYQVLEKYLQLARDAGVSGDRIAAENYLQHADHYYRVIQSMNDGQRPRVGGRDISVADFNVQNVSQGLSAALYTGGQAPQPNIGDPGNTNPNPQQGNGGNSGGNGNVADDGEEGADGDDSVGNAPQQQGRGPRRQQHNRHGQYHNGSNGQNGAAQGGANASGQNPASNVPSGEATRDAAAPTVENAASAPASPAQPIVTATRVGDEQPDYPDDLLPAQTAGDTSGRDEVRTPRAPRVPRQRTRRPRAASSEAAGDAPGEPALPGVDGGE